MRSASASAIVPVVDDQPVTRRHPHPHDRVAGDEPHVALGQQSAQPSLAIDHRQRADARPRHQTTRRVDGRVSVNRVRVGDDAVLRPLHGRDLGDLRPDVTGPEAAIDDADAHLPRRARSPWPPASRCPCSPRRSGGCSVSAPGESRATSRPGAGRGAAAHRSCGVSRKSSNVHAAHELEQVHWSSGCVIRVTDQNIQSDQVPERQDENPSHKWSRRTEGGQAFPMSWGLR